MPKLLIPTCYSDSHINPRATAIHIYKSILSSTHLVKKAQRVVVVTQRMLAALLDVRLQGVARNHSEDALPAPASVIW